MCVCAVNAAGAAYAGGVPPTLLSWCPVRRTLALAGRAGRVRLWDASTELLLADIDTGMCAPCSVCQRLRSGYRCKMYRCMSAPTECEAAATSLWRGAEGALLVLGFADGAVRAWDERSPRAPLWTLQQHAAPVLRAAHRPDLYTMVTGW